MELNWDNEQDYDIDIDQVMCNAPLSLEPRLQEYLNKKKYYGENNIKPVVPLEQEYMITDNDRRTVITFLNGDQDIYNFTKAKQSTIGMETVAPTKNFFPSSKFKPDKRLEKMKEKQKRDREAIRQRNNYGNMSESSNITNLKFSTQTGDDDHLYKSQRQSINDAYDAPLFLDSKYSEQENKYRINYKPDKLTEQHIPSTIQYKQTKHYEKPINKHNKSNDYLPHDTNVNKIIGNLDTYVDHTNTIYHQNLEMDTDQKVIKPALNTNGKCNLNTSRYQPIPYMGTKAGLKDINIANSLQCGLPSRGSKSYGYKNPSEHYFDYIDGDIQKPEHTVLPFPRGGMQTRYDNHGDKYRPKYGRDIY